MAQPEPSPTPIRAIGRVSVSRKLVTAGTVRFSLCFTAGQGVLEQILSDIGHVGGQVTHQVGVTGGDRGQTLSNSQASRTCV